MLQVQNSGNHNGLILKTNYIPEELLIQILSYVDYKQLIICHLVCKQWDTLIKQNVWCKKAERTCGQPLFVGNRIIPWSSYYSICHKKPFKRNLLTSNDVQIFYDDHEDSFKVIQINMKANNPQINILPYPEDPLFKENINCIKIIHNNSIVSVKRKFVIDLIKEGFTDYILDNLQPAIEVCEWYCTVQKEEMAEFECSIKLLYGIDNEDCYTRIMRVYHFDKKLNSPNKRGKWFKFTHVFKNYGPGLRMIKFYDGGHNDIIMAGASVTMSVPLRKSVST